MPVYCPISGLRRCSCQKDVTRMMHMWHHCPIYQIRGLLTATPECRAYLAPCVPQCGPHEAVEDEGEQAQQVEQHKGQRIVVEHARQQRQVVAHPQCVGGKEEGVACGSRQHTGGWPGVMLGASASALQQGATSEAASMTAQSSDCHVVQKQKESEAATSLRGWWQLTHLVWQPAARQLSASRAAHAAG